MYHKRRQPERQVKHESASFVTTALGCVLVRALGLTFEVALRCSTVEVDCARKTTCRLSGRADMLWHMTCKIESLQTPVCRLLKQSGMSWSFLARGCWCSKQLLNSSRGNHTDIFGCRLYRLGEEGSVWGPRNACTLTTLHFHNCNQRISGIVGTNRDSNHS